MPEIRMMNLSLKKKLFWGIAILLVLALFLASCGNSRNTSAAAYPAAPSATPAASSEADYSGEAAPIPAPDMKNGGLADSGSSVSQSTSQNVVSQRKLIMDGNVSIETYDFDKSVALMDQMIVHFGGFAETRTVKGKSEYSYAKRNANYVIRVPAESFDAVLKEMGNIGTVLESNSQGTDITDQYTDFESRVKTLKVQEQTLLDIMAKSTKLEDVITLESRIAEVRYEIEKIENTLRNYDRLVAFSRITIYIQEVNDKTETKPVPETLSERVSGSFNQSLEDFKTGFEDFLVWLAGAWISLLFLAIIIVVLILWIRKTRKKQMTPKAQIQEVKSEHKEE